MNEALAFEAVRFAYRPPEFCLDGLSFSVARGEMLCVRGANGSGKSTLARLGNGLLLPEAGSVSVFGTDTRDADEAARAGDLGPMARLRADVGLVFQNPEDQIIAGTVEQDVAFGPENLGLSPAEIRQRIDEALDAVGMTGFEAYRIDELSGGQRQRVAIAGVLALRPRILVLDEAASMLDPMGREGFLRVLKRLREEGMTIVSISHDNADLAIADRVIELAAGRVAFEGIPRAYLRHRSEGARAKTGQQAKAAMTGESQTRGGCGMGAAPDHRVVEEASSVSYSYGKHKRQRGGTSKSRVRAEAATPRWGNDPATHWMLQGANLQLRAGEVLGLVGHTGSGKSTLLSLLAGQLRPTAGRILLEGEDLSRKEVARCACRRVGLVFQRPEMQLFAPTVAEDIAFGPRNLGLGDAETDERITVALEAVGLPPELRERSPFELSGGQQRRVAIAGVLAMRPAIVLMDEPSAGLDDEGCARLVRLIAMQRGEGRAVVVVTHDMELLRAVADRVMVLNEGSVYAMGAPEEVLAPDAGLERIGLRSPYAFEAREDMPDGNPRAGFREPDAGMLGGIGGIGGNVGVSLDEFAPDESAHEESASDSRADEIARRRSAR